MAFFCSKYCEKTDHNFGFSRKKRHRLPKLAKIAETIDHNINPRMDCMEAAGGLLPSSDFSCMCIHIFHVCAYIFTYVSFKSCPNWAGNRQKVSKNFDFDFLK
jgi:hypothetical protein